MRRVRSGHRPANTQALAGFLFASQGRHKTHCILISCIFLAFFSLFSTRPIYGLDTGSSSFDMELVTFLNTGGSASSGSYLADLIASGENIVPLEGILSSGFSLGAGQVYLLVPVFQREKIKVIGDLRARTEILGAPIDESIWQIDNDPYFYWEIIIEPPELITGFSVSLDAPPDTTIDTLTSSYQVPEDSILSGKHTFYVLAFTTGGIAEEQSLLKFDFWVDVDTPIISQVGPPAGESIADSSIPITCLLYDIDSSIDKDLTTMTLNDQVVYFDYDPETRLLKVAPGTFAEGQNTVLLKAYDQVGNYVVKGWNFIVDTQAPSGSMLINNGEEITHSAYVFLNLNTEDAVSAIKSVFISNDGVFDAELDNPYTYSAVISNWLLAQPEVDGRKTVYVKYQDSAGNFSEVYQDEISVKLMTPDTRIISGPTVVAQEPEADFKYEATRPGCQFSYKLDELNWSNWSGSAEANFKDLNQGNHYFYVKSAFDLNGDGKITIDEEDALPAQWVWNVKTKTEIEELPRRILFWRR